MLGEGSFTYGVSLLRIDQEEPVSAGGDGAGKTDTEGDGSSSAGRAPQRLSSMRNGVADPQAAISAELAAFASSTASAAQHTGMVFALNPSLTVPMVQTTHNLAALSFGLKKQRGDRS